MSKFPRQKEVIVLRTIVVLILVVLLGIFGVIFINLMSKSKSRAENKKDTETATIDEAEEYEEYIEEESTVADVSDLDIKPNGDAAAPIDEDSWMAGKTFYHPEMTDSTNSLPVADLSVFNQPIEDEDGADSNSQPEDADAPGAWEKVTLSLNSVEGSINHTSPGDPVKTEQLTSTYMVLIDLDTDTIVAERDCHKVVSPASMTKILTVLTARDFIDESNLDDTFVITADILDYVEKNDCSAVGFQVDDEVTVRDLLYGTILCSGADAAIGLARYCCGSEESFVNNMNTKVDQLGLSETAHFTNVVGIYNPDLHCTMVDMGVILGMAVQDDLLRDVLSKRTYLTSTKYEELDMPDGIEISNWFLRRIEDKEMNGEVIAAKTGFVNEAGCCAASYYEAANGKKYICVTGNAFSSWRAIYDHVSVYRSLIP